MKYKNELQKEAKSSAAGENFCYKMQLVHFFSPEFFQRPPLLQLIHSWINCILRNLKIDPPRSKQA